jgi:hypothetical protein
MSSYAGPEAADASLLLLYDPSNPKCYPGTGTTLTDLSGNGITGTLTSGPVFGYQSGGTLYLDGTNDHISLSNTLLNFSTGDFSVDFWYYHQVAPTAYDVFFEIGGQGLQLGFNSGGSNVLFYSAAANVDLTGYAHGMTLGSWYHLAFTRIGGVITVYVNGVSIGTSSGKTGSFSPISGVVANIGKYTGGSGEQLTGRLGPFRVYKGYGLTQADVLQYYNATRSRFQTPSESKAGLLLNLDAGNAASYPGSGSTWTDLSGNSNTVTLYNGPTFNSGNGGSIVFDGSNDYAETASISTTITEKTLAGWVQLGNVSQTASGLVGVMSTDGSVFDTIVYNETGSGWGFGSDFFNRTIWSGVLETSTSAWSHIVATYANNNYRMYRNGVLIASTASYLTRTFSTSSKLILGKRTLTSTGPLNGKIAHASIYNRALSAVEVGANFDALRSRFGL